MLACQIVAFLFKVTTGNLPNAPGTEHWKPSGGSEGTSWKSQVSKGLSHGLRLKRLHLSLTHEGQCWTAIGSGINNGDDVSSRSGKTSLQMQPNGGAPNKCFWMQKSAPTQLAVRALPPFVWNKCGSRATRLIVGPTLGRPSRYHGPPRRLNAA